MLTTLKCGFATTLLAAVLPLSLFGQSSGSTQAQRLPSKPERAFVVMHAQKLAEIERRLRPENRVEELIGGSGMQLRVAVQHEVNKTASTGEIHDESDDVYYVLEGTATLTLGGRLDAPSEVEPGEWRGPRIIDGQTLAISKGDLIVVPRGTAHQRSTVGKDFSMILIKVFAEPIRSSPSTSSPPVPKK